MFSEHGQQAGVGPAPLWTSRNKINQFFEDTLHTEDRDINKNGQQGFTLIELIVVIVILGILAAVAIPKFVDFSKEARIANLKATAASLQAAANMGYGQANIRGDGLGSSGTVAVTGIGDVAFSYGWPTATTAGIGQMLIDPDDEKWTFTSTNAVFKLKDDCDVTYTPAAGVNTPAKIVIKDDC